MKNVARGRKYIRKECENFLKIKYKNTCKKLEEKMASIMFLLLAKANTVFEKH